MNHHRTWVIPAWTVGIALFIAVDVWAEQYRDAAQRFTLELPEEWGLMPADALAAINDSARDKVNPSVRYIGGFQLKSKPPADPPYILIQFKPGRMEGLPFEQLELELSNRPPERLEQIDGKISDVFSTLTDGISVIERARRRLLMRTHVVVAGFGPVTGISCGMIGNDGLINLHCYSREAEFTQYLPAFEAIADSFRFDPGFEYVPPSPPPSQSPVTWPDMAGGLVGAIFGAVFAGVAVAVCWFLGKLVRKSRLQ